MEGSRNQLHFIFFARLMDGAMLISQITSPVGQARSNEIYGHASVLVKKQGQSQVDCERLKSDFGGHAWHTISDKNSLLYGVVTSAEYPDDLANLLLRQFARNLYE